MEGAVPLGRLEIGAALIQQHHGVEEALVQAGAGFLVGENVLQAHGALRPPPHDGAEADIARASDVRGVEGEKGSAVQHQAF